jgi:ketosteroid isomerase-like protein
MKVVPLFAPLLAGLALAAVLAAAESDKTEQEAKEVIGRYHKALLANDTEAIEKMVAANALITTTEGVAQTREEWLEPLKSGAAKVIALEASDWKVRGLGETILASYRADVRLSAQGSDVEIPCRVTLVLAKRGGDWQVVASSTVVIIQAGAGG